MTTDDPNKHHYISPGMLTPVDLVWCATCLAVVDKSMVAPHMQWHRRTS